MCIVALLNMLSKLCIEVLMPYLEKLAGLLVMKLCWSYLKRECLPVLLYGTEACPLKKSSFQFVVNNCFAEIFNTRSKDVINDYQLHFHFDAISDIITKRKKISEQISKLREFIVFSCLLYMITIIYLVKLS